VATRTDIATDEDARQRRWQAIGSGVGLAMASTGLGFSLSCALRRPWIAAVGTVLGVTTGALYMREELQR
jgi:hypothetical protein